MFYHARANGEVFCTEQRLTNGENVELFSWSINGDKAIVVINCPSFDIANHMLSMFRACLVSQQLEKELTSKDVSW